MQLPNLWLIIYGYKCVIYYKSIYLFFSKQANIMWSPVSQNGHKYYLKTQRVQNTPVPRGLNR